MTAIACLCYRCGRRAVGVACLQELRAVSRLVKKGERGARRQQRRQQQNAALWGLTRRMIRVALAVYCLSKYSKDCAVEFATRARKKRKAEVFHGLETDCPIQQWFVDSDLDEVVAVFMPQSRDDYAIRTEAVKFLAEKKTVEWVASQNFRLGQAPTALSLVSNFSANLRALGVEPPFRLNPSRQGRGPTLSRSGRRWCQKMRKRWGLRRRTLGEGPQMTREEVVGKAGNFGVRVEAGIVFKFCFRFLCFKRVEDKNGFKFEAKSGFSPEVKAFWHWIDFLTQQCAAEGKTPCYINLDETSIPRSTAKVSGFVAPKRLWPGLAPPRRRIQKQQKRAAVTQVVLITDMVDIQPKLPQIFPAMRELSQLRPWRLQIFKNQRRCISGGENPGGTMFVTCCVF